MAASIRNVHRVFRELGNFLSANSHLFRRSRQIQTLSSSLNSWGSYPRNHSEFFPDKKRFLKKAMTRTTVPTLRACVNIRFCSTTRSCWNCHELLAKDSNSVFPLFCPKCNSIQPLQEDIDYFQRLNCKKTFDLSSEELTRIFRDLQRHLHPDKFSTKSQQEQEFSALQSSFVNKAYRTLLKPLARGLYMLKLEGYSVEEGDSDIEPGFLMEIMEINEEIAETQDLDIIRKIKEDNSVKLEELLKDLSAAFSKGNFEDARKILKRLKYYSNIDDKVKERLGTSTVI